MMLMQCKLAVRKQVLSLYKRKGLLTEEDAENLKSWKGNGGFSVNADVRIESEIPRGQSDYYDIVQDQPFQEKNLTLSPV